MAFVEHLPRSDAQRTIVDLGCGNGVIGLVAATRNPQAALAFVDESFMAVASANAKVARYYRRTKQLPANWKSAAFACHCQSLLRFCPDSARFQLYRCRFLHKKKET